MPNSDTVFSFLLLWPESKATLRKYLIYSLVYFPSDFIHVFHLWMCKRKCLKSAHSKKIIIIIRNLTIKEYFRSYKSVLQGETWWVRKTPLFGNRSQVLFHFKALSYSFLMFFCFPEWKKKIIKFQNCFCNSPKHPESSKRWNFISKKLLCPIVNISNYMQINLSLVHSY